MAFILLSINTNGIVYLNNPITASNMFNNFFINIAKNITNKSPSLKKYYELKNISFNDIFSKTIDSSDVLKMINNL